MNTLRDLTVTVPVHAIGNQNAEERPLGMVADVWKWLGPRADYNIPKRNVCLPIGSGRWQRKL